MNSIACSTEKRATLSRRQLTLALILVTLLPCGLAVLMWYSTPTSAEPTLDAEVKVGPAAWPDDGSAAARTVPCVELHNPTGDNWENISLSINEQFYFYSAEPLPGGQQLRVPLVHFHTKGNQIFTPDKHEIRHITVFAQIPSGARAILEVDANGQPKRPD